MFATRQKPEPPHCSQCGAVMRPAALSPCIFDGKVGRRRRSDNFVFCPLFDDIICSAVNCFVTAINEGFSEEQIREGCPNAIWAEGPGPHCPGAAITNPAPVPGYACPRCGATNRLIEKRAQWQRSRRPSP